MVSFDNTEIAFESKSNKELRKAHLLFSILASKLMVNTGKAMTGFAFSLHLPVKPIIRRTIFQQFVGGESIEECEHTIQRLAKYHIGTILDYSVEGQEDEASFDKTQEEILRTIAKSAGDDRIPFTVFKVTGMARTALLEKVSSGGPLSQGEQEEWARVRKRIHSLCAAAADIQKPILIDAEESWIQQGIDDLGLEMMLAFNRRQAIVFNTAQLYRHDRLAYVRELHRAAVDQDFIAGLKLVRGAYMEKERERATEHSYPDPIQPDKESSDRDFDLAVAFCLDHLDRIAMCAGTHNEASCMKLTDGMNTRQIPANHPHVWFAQLLGMSDHISFNLSNEGYNVAKYVPYGPVKKLMPYLFRRAEENTSVKGQTGRELSLIKKELARRRKTTRSVNG